MDPNILILDARGCDQGLPRVRRFTEEQKMWHEEVRLEGEWFLGSVTRPKSLS